MKVTNNFTYSLSTLITGVALAILISTVSISPPNAYAGTDWMVPGHIYDSWNADQYDPCNNDGSTLPFIVDNNTADPLQTVHFDVPNAIIPAVCYAQNATITNNSNVPVELTFKGGFDSGPLADYVFQWVTGWNDITLQPGGSTPQFTFHVGMPWDVPMEAQDLAGKFWYEWELKMSGSTPTPPAAVNDGSTDSASPDAITTPYQTPINIDVMANDTTNGASLANVAGDNGAWSIVNNQVHFVPANGFSGVARATYTITNADGSSNADIFVIVLADPYVGGDIYVPGSGVGQAESGFSAAPVIAVASLVVGVIILRIGARERT
jgi:hypothetical protein